ncbi:hypothetical protein [Argonema galeatum]|nr:hypothetical protein [Argonema galeatum]
MILTYKGKSDTDGKSQGPIAIIHLAIALEDLQARSPFMSS